LTTFVFSSIINQSPLALVFNSSSSSRKKEELMKKLEEKELYFSKFFGSSFLSFTLHNNRNTNNSLSLSLFFLSLSLLNILHNMSFVVYHPSLMMNYYS
jgi:hypothetical protein